MIVGQGNGWTRGGGGGVFAETGPRESMKARTISRKDLICGLFGIALWRSAPGP